MSYLIELRSPTCPAAYVVAQAETRADARALIDAELERDEEMDGVEIVAIHSIH